MPRDTQSLLQTLNMCKEKSSNKKYLSNVEQYAKSFMDFVVTVLTDEYQTNVVEK
jgi:hypothetical protein